MSIIRKNMTLKTLITIKKKKKTKANSNMREVRRMTSMTSETKITKRRPENHQTLSSTILSSQMTFSRFKVGVITPMENQGREVKAIPQGSSSMSVIRDQERIAIIVPQRKTPIALSTASTKTTASLRSNLQATSSASSARSSSFFCSPFCWCYT
jgi:hypothetical protein